MRQRASDGDGPGPQRRSPNRALAFWLRSRVPGVIAAVAAILYALVVVAKHGALPFPQECAVVFAAVFALVHLTVRLRSALASARRAPRWKDPNTL